MIFFAHFASSLFGFVIFFILLSSDAFAFSYPLGSLYDGSFFSTGPKWLPTKVQSNQKPDYANDHKTSSNVAGTYYPFGSLIDGSFFSTGPKWLPTKVSTSQGSSNANANKYSKYAAGTYQNQAQAQGGRVLGANDGPGFFGKLFSGISSLIAGIADALWPFEGKDEGLAQAPTTVTQAIKSSSPQLVASPSPPSKLAQTGEVEVSTAVDDTNVVVVAVPDTITNSSLTVGGNLTIGDTNADRLKVNALLQSDLLLDKSKSYTLGNGGERFKAGYFSDNIYIGDENRLSSDGMNVKGSMYLNTRSSGSIYLDADSGIVYLGEGTNKLSNADNNTALTIDPAGTGRVQFHSASNFIDADGNMTIVGTLTQTGSGGSSSDSVDITPATNIDALDITGTNITTADLIDLDATATTAGDAIDINMANTRTSGSAILITDASVAATVTGDLIQINVTGTPDTNTIDIDVSAAASGNMIDLATTDVAYTGDAINISLGASAVGAQGLVMSTSAGIRTASAIAITENNTTGTVATFDIDSGATRGGLFDIDTSGAFITENLIDITTGAQAWTANIIDVNVGAAASTGDVINVSMGSSNLLGGAFVIADAGGARTDALVDITSASTATTDAGSIMQINGTGIMAGANVFDINVSGGSTSGNVIDVTTSGTLTASNLIDLNFGVVADTGDAINVAMGSTAVAAQALVVVSSGVSTVDLIDISSTGVVTTAQDLMQLAYTAGDGTDVTQSVLHTQLTTSGAGLAATDIAAGILVEQVAEAGSGTERGIMFSGAWDAEIYLQNTETISNVTDDSIVLTGAGGTNNETFTIDLDSVASSGATLSSGGSFVLVNDNLSVGIDGNTTENIASSDFAFSGNDLYVDDKFAVNGTASFDGNLWQGDAVTTTTKTTAFLFLGTTAGAPTGDPTTPAGFAAIVYDTTNNKLCAEEEAGGAAWLCTGALVDIAEWMPAAGAESGDLVSVTNLPNPTEDPTAPFMLAKTTKAYDNKLVGVISKYAEDAESALGYKRSPDYHAVTLVGRVPVKVSGENGPIARGDYLTSSLTPGHAMKATKAGPVAGMALESFNGESGTVMVFVKAAWFDPVAEQKAAVLAALGAGSYTPIYPQVLGATTQASDAGEGSAETGNVVGASTLVGPAPDGSLGVLAEEVDLLVHGLLTANNLRVTTAAEFTGTLVVRGLATFEGDLVVKGAFSTGSLDLSGALTKTMTAGTDLSAGDPVVVVGANTVARAGGPSANVVGLVASSASAGSVVRVAIAGTVGGYSGLAVGTRYYVGGGGVVTTSPGETSAVHIGIAVSSSELIVQIFATQVPKEEPAVVDVATVDTGPTVGVVDSTAAPETSQPQALPSPDASPSPTPAAFLELTTQPSPGVSPSPSPVL